MTRGLLLMNLGTPDAPEPGPVRRYLREFLSDPRVLDISPALRAFLLNVVILPRRPKQSAEAYEKIWTERGSPLLYHGLDLAAKVQSLVRDRYHVELCMRYQNPSVKSALEGFRRRGLDDFVLFPMFPQYSSAAWGSAVVKVFEEMGALWDVPSVQVVPPYYDHPAFIEAFAAVTRPVLDDVRPDYVLHSYHGVPERHCTKSDPSGEHCLKREDCCGALVEVNRFCYRAQCFATARALAAALGHTEKDYEVAFQSRLGKDPWIRPYTDEVVPRLAREGIKRLAVLCPAFVTDCLETIEEIGMRADEDFRAAGGEKLTLVPSLNASEAWAQAIVRLVDETRTPAPEA
jgi:protoporphyrin/coproporphyrin ferrochelatase